MYILFIQCPGVCINNISNYQYISDHLLLAGLHLYLYLEMSATVH